MGCFSTGFHKYKVQYGDSLFLSSFFLHEDLFMINLTELSYSSGMWGQQRPCKAFGIVYKPIS